MEINGVQVTPFDSIMITLLVLLIFVAAGYGLYRLWQAGYTRERRAESDRIRGQRLPPDYDVEDNENKFPRPSGRGWGGPLLTPEGEEESRNRDLYGDDDDNRD